VSNQGQTAHGELTWRWDLPATQEDWTYATGVDFQRSNGTWKATWEPSLVAPELAEDEVLRIQTVQPERGKILGAGDQPLAMKQTIHRVGLDLREVPREKREGSATALAKAVGIDPEPYRESVRQADDNAWVEAIALREEDFRALDAQSMKRIPGLLVTKDARVLGRTKGFAAETLGSVGEATAEEIEKSGGKLTRGAQIGRGGLQEAHEATLQGKPGVVVDRIGVHADGSLKTGQAHQLMAQGPVPGEDLHTTLNGGLQEAAQRTL
ncbi:NTF2-like N-terminal transpeptidase domain-containing protein, partial [Streptococcus pneumoniae]|uniref:NTF2-like N-terminal transpeptidase domain-containing protein n=2 Tax=Bacillati TaxID=1783272 RepID=UPI00046C41B2